MNRIIRHVCGIGIAAATAVGVAAGSAVAAPGDPSPGFGTDGVNEFVTYGRPQGLAFLPGGRVVMGYVLQDEGTLLLRLMKADGTLETTFGDGGEAAITSGYDSADIVDVQVAAGRIVVLLQEYELGLGPVVTVAKFDFDGDPDTAFGVDGRASFGAGAELRTARAMEARPDGSVYVLADGEGTSSPMIYKLNDVGEPDLAFSGDGQAAVPRGRSTVDAWSFDVSDAGGIVVGSTRDVAGRREVMLSRMTATGARKSGFGAASFVTYKRLDNVITDIAAVSFAPGGRIVFTGWTAATDSAKSRALTARFASGTGAIDTSFSGDGVVIMSAPGRNWSAADIAVQADGKVLVASSLHGPERWVITRYTTAGGLDATFSGDGMVKTAVGVGESAYVHRMAMRPDGSRVAIVGTVNDDFDLPIGLGSFSLT